MPLFVRLNRFYASLDKSQLAIHLCSNYIDLNYRFMDTNENVTSCFKIINNYSIQTQFPRIADYLFVDKCMDMRNIQAVREMIDKIKVRLFSLLLKS